MNELETTTEQLQECIRLHQDIDVSNLVQCEGIVFHDNALTTLLMFFSILVISSATASVFALVMSKLVD